MVILRIGFLCQSAYEWAAHARAGRAAGLTGDEIKRIAQGPDAGWSADGRGDAAAVDELYDDDAVAPATWARLATRFDQQAATRRADHRGRLPHGVDGLNTFGVPPEPNSEPLPPLP